MSISNIDILSFTINLFPSQNSVVIWPYLYQTPWIFKLVFTIFYNRVILLQTLQILSFLYKVFPR